MSFDEILLFYLSWVVVFLSPLSIGLALYNVVRVFREIPPKERTVALVFFGMILFAVIAGTIQSIITLHNFYTGNI